MESIPPASGHQVDPGRDFLQRQYRQPPPIEPAALQPARSAADADPRSSLAQQRHHFARGRRGWNPRSILRIQSYLAHGVGAVLIGGWRISDIQTYSSGAPVGISSGVSLPIFGGRQAATVTTYDGWRGAQAGSKFDPQTDRFFQPAAFFGPQPNNA